MNTVTVGQLRQNPTGVLADVEGGATYTITRHNHVVGRIVPAGEIAEYTPPRKPGGASTRKLNRVRLTTATTVDELLADEKGAW